MAPPWVHGLFIVIAVVIGIVAITIGNWLSVASMVLLLLSQVISLLPPSRRKAAERQRRRARPSNPEAHQAP